MVHQIPRRLARDLAAGHRHDRPADVSRVSLRISALAGCPGMAWNGVACRSRDRRLEASDSVLVAVWRGVADFVTGCPAPLKGVYGTEGEDVGDAVICGVFALADYFDPRAQLCIVVRCCLDDSLPQIGV